MKRLKEIFQVTSLPVFVASLCCLAPVVLVAAGVSTVAFGISLTNILDGQYRWAFQLTGILALVISIIFYFRKRGVCTLDDVKKHRNEVINKTILFGIIAIVFYHLFFNIFLTWAGTVLKLWGQ